MTIGVIGPKSSCYLIKRNLHDIDETIKVRCYEKEQVNETADVIEDCEKECDATLFSGCAIESFIQKKYVLRNPYTSVERSVISVAEAFLKMQKNEMELDAFSIDIVEKQVIEDLLDAFEIQARNIYSSSFQPGVEESEYVDWHIQLQKEGKTNTALTSLVWVYQMLCKKGYSAYYLGPTRAMVRPALERIKKECALTKAEYSQIAVEILRLTNYEQNHENYYSGMLNKTEIEVEIIRYVKSVQGAFFSFGRREYVIFSNTGVIKDIQNYNYLRRLQEQIYKNGILLYSGIGMGTTAYTAEMNARKALDYALKRAKKEIFQVDENNVLKGPLGIEERLQYSLISSDPQILKISQKTGLSTESIAKLMAISKVRQSNVFDAKELAECLEITDRSARRILNKIMEAGYGSVCAKETAISGGRPRSLVELNFQLTADS